MIEDDDDGNDDDIAQPIMYKCKNGTMWVQDTGSTEQGWRQSRNVVKGRGATKST